MKFSVEYVAGFFDGEGCIGIYSRKDRLGGFCLRTQLTQNVSVELLELLDFLVAAYGGHYSYQKTLSGNTKANWQLSSSNAMKFLESIEPFLVLKKTQAVVAIEFQKNRPTIKRNSNGQILCSSEKAVEFSQSRSNELKRLKQPQIISIKG